MLLASASRRVAATPALGHRAASAIASKYSKATYNAALKKSPATLSKVQTELSNLSNAIKSKPEIAAFVHNPTLSSKDRIACLATLFSSLEGSGAKKEPVSDITKNLLTVLSDNGRLRDAEDVIEGFNELVAQYKGELTVFVTSATPLPKDILTRLETTLKQSQSGQKAKVLSIVNKVFLRRGCLQRVLHDIKGKPVGVGRPHCGLW